MPAEKKGRRLRVENRTVVATGASSQSKKEKNSGKEQGIGIPGEPSAGKKTEVLQERAVPRGV